MAGLTDYIFRLHECQVHINDMMFKGIARPAALELKAHYLVRISSERKLIKKK